MSSMRCSSGRRAATPLVAACLLAVLLGALAIAVSPPAHRPPLLRARAAPPHAGGGEASLRMPDVGSIEMMGVNGRTLLVSGLGVCVLGLVFGLVIFRRVKALPVHPSMREISELIYETCKTYLVTQGKFLLILEIFIGFIIVLYFGFLLRLEPIRVADHPPLQSRRHRRELRRRVVRHADQHVRELADGVRQPRGQALPVYSIPLESGMSIGMLLISVELFLMLCILLFIPGEYAGPCFIGFAIGESLGAAALRIAGGIFTKIADIGSDLMKIVFNIKEDDARNPGVIADCTGDNAGDSVGPTADGFETYGVTGRRAHLLHSPGREGSDRPGPAAGLDLHDAGADDRGQRRLVPRSTRRSPAAAMRMRGR